MKTRKLVFNGNETDREMFPFLYQGFVSGGNGPQPKGMEVLRREVRILDKLEAISVPEMVEHDGKQVETGARLLKEGNQELELEQPEYELLKRYFESTPWTTKVARQVVNISDWLAAIPLEENGG